MRKLAVIGLLATFACGPAGGPTGRLVGAGQALGEGDGAGGGKKDAGTFEVEEGCPSPTLESIQRDVFVPRCVRCHSGDSAPEMLALDGPLNELAARLEDGAAQSPSHMPLVTPNQIGPSYLFLKISLPTPLVGERMPPEARLPDCEIAAIRHWIEVGAP